MRFYDLDIDVKNYAKRIVDAGYKCPADINSVSDFVKALKAYNYYNSLIEGFYFRGLQNAGSGSIAYGLKQYNGILKNGPTWKDNGIDLGDADNSRIIEAPVILSSNPIPLTFIFIGSGSRSVKIAGENLFGSFQRDQYYTPEYISIQGLSTRFRGVFDSSIVTEQVFHDASGTSNFPSTRDTFFCVQAVFRQTNISFSKNGATFSTSSALSNIGYQGSYRVVLGGRINNSTLDQFYGGIISAVFIFQGEIDQANIYNLYKSTAGKGLGLP
jgi:hypothetical protein